MLQTTDKLPYVSTRVERAELIEKLAESNVLKGPIRWCTEKEKSKRPTASAIHSEVKALYEKYKSKLVSQVRAINNQLQYMLTSKYKSVTNVEEKP